MNPEKPRIVSLGSPPRVEDEAQDERLEELLKQANLLGPENNQNGTGPRNSSKAIRAERRAKKLARKKSRYK